MNEPERTHALLSAAVAGLMLGTVSCTDDPEAVAPVDDEPKVTSTTKDESMTFAKFSQACVDAAGFVMVHATCAGNNACRGFSYNKFSYEHVEHTCRGMNSCGGMSCVIAADDEGRDAAEVYADTCSGCHGATQFKLFQPPGADLDAALEKFAAKSNDRLEKNVAFGVGGMTEAGTQLANMPAHHELLSRAEIAAVVAYLRTLPAVAEEYGVVGENEEIGDAGE